MELEKNIDYFQIDTIIKKMGTRKILVVYHRADYDGVFSGVIAKKYYESKGIHVDAFGWNYGDDPIDVKSKIR